MNAIERIRAERERKQKDEELVLAIAESCADDLVELEEANKRATDAKNAADEGSGIKSGIWTNVKAIIAKVHDNAPKELREQVFTTILHDFLVPKTGPDGKAMKLTTVGQYASTGRKVLTTLMTQQGVPFATLDAESYADVRKRFRNPEETALLNDVAKCNEMLRFIAKKGEKDTRKATIAALMEAITEEYNPVKAKADAGKRAAMADKELRDNRQQHPAAPSQVETVAGNLAAEEEEAGINDDRKQAAA